MKKLITIILVLISVSCVNDDGPCHQSVKIINNSDKTIYYQVGTQLGLGANPSLSGNYFKISPHSSKKDLYGGERGCYEDTFAKWSTLYYNILDAEVVNSNDWEDVRANDMILERFQFTVEDMNTAEWQVIYNE